MKFSSDAQRRAMFAKLSSSMSTVRSVAASHMFSNRNKFAKTNLDYRPIFKSDSISSLADKLRYSPDFVEGYTGASIQLPDRYVNGPKALYGKKLDLEDDAFFYHNLDEDKDTYILAGEDFKRGLYQKGIPELRNITLGSDDNKKFIREAAAMERAVGRPVYSSKPKDKMTALELAKQTYDNLLKNPNMTREESLRASKGYLIELVDVKDGDVRKWANKELGNIYHDV